MFLPIPNRLHRKISPLHKRSKTKYNAFSNRYLPLVSSLCCNFVLVWAMDRPIHLSRLVENWELLANVCVRLKLVLWPNCVSLPYSNAYVAEFPSQLIRTTVSGRDCI